MGGSPSDGMQILLLKIEEWMYYEKWYSIEFFEKIFNKKSHFWGKISVLSNKFQSKIEMFAQNSSILIGYWLVCRNLRSFVSGAASTQFIKKERNKGA